jgi:hypothetical protein
VVVGFAEEWMNDAYFVRESLSEQLTGNNIQRYQYRYWWTCSSPFVELVDVNHM